MTSSGHSPCGSTLAPDWAAPTDDEVAALSDTALLAAVSDLEEASRQLDVAKARYSSEVSRRSRRELGNAGLAARQGFVNAESLLRSVTRTGLREASRRIRVGELLTDAAAAAELGVAAPLSRVATAVLDGRLGLDGADQVIRALTPIVGEVDKEQLALATSTLAAEAASHDADEMGTMARGVRDTLDRIGVIDRERHLRDQRALRRGPVIDGLRRVSLVLDPENDALIMGAIDHAMSPRLGGPRFTHTDDKERADQLIADPRTNEQLALDTLASLVRIGVDRDDGAVLGSMKPAVRVTISLDDLTRAVDSHGVEHPETDTGVAWLEGSSEPVSAATARRYLCDVGALPVVLSGCGEPLDLGRPRRLFSGPQRVALATRDGGCRFSGCDRPPSWCEAHHIDPYGKGGRTDVGNGVLLCRRHHLLLHDHGWQIVRGRDPGQLLLIPPASVDPERVPWAMPSKLPRWLRPG